MGHTCSSALVRCMDFRLESAIEEYMDSADICGDADVIAFAGAAKNLNEEPSGPVETQIDLSKKLHEINTLILMNHTDCGGYGGREAFESPEAEREHHLSELTKAKERMAEKYPDLTIKLALADIREDGSVNIEEIQ